ncbi:MmpS family transport accessory protein [Streptomyces sp. NPDC002012]|uniref:MmpS family transport accessory protein n=1 Tax=unclassified Streptomyces TaxID=2593676 RepID=UPI002E15861E|nr:MmpS family transport accessory protein [Streptomyces sp. NBC_01224]
MNRTVRNIRNVRTIRTAVCAAVALGLAVGLGACSETVDQVDKAVDETYEVTYEVTGTSVDEIQFHAGGGKAMDPEIETVKSPKLPWRKTVTLRGIMPPAVMPIALDEDGADVTCSITHKGKVIKEAKGEGLVTAGGCVAVSPVTG